MVVEAVGLGVNFFFQCFSFGCAKSKGVSNLPVCVAEWFSSLHERSQNQSSKLRIEFLSESGNGGPPDPLNCTS